METIHRWPSVRAGENKWIFRIKKMRCSVFNTAMLFELAVLKTQADHCWNKFQKNSKEYSEAYRLLKFLKYFSAD